MPSTPYDLVKDDYDLRVPLHAEQAFFRGIVFQAKFIGWQEVPRPNTRTEIVQAMRRIRYECKIHNVKKRKVTINISVDGVKVTLKKKKRKKKQWTNDADDVELMHHPIYRIFYVSHDSSDLKILSYIARDASTDTFRCCVFKSTKKSQAMRIVRTVGQAFEVCHKFNLQKNSLTYNDDTSDQSCDLLDNDKTSDRLSIDDEPKKDPVPLTPDPSPHQRPNYLDITPQTNFNCRKSPCSDGDKSPSSPISTTKEIQQLKEQLEQQSLQTREALAQLMLVRERLISETNARLEAQARTQQLLQQNRELLEHLASMGGYTETDRTGLTSANIGLAPQSQLQMLLQDQAVDLTSPVRKAFLTTSNNNNLATINQQLNSLGSINQQLNTLSHQLSGLNQQSQNLQNFQNLGSLGYATASSPFPSFSHVQQLNSNLGTLTQPNHDLRTQQELYQMNQELLNRLQNLNLNLNSPTMKLPNGHNANSNNNGNNNSNNNNNSPQSSYILANPGHISNSSSNNNFNFLNSPSSMGNLTPSPIGTLNRNSYSNSPMDDSLGLSIDKNLNDIDDTHFIKPLSQVGTLTTLDADGKVKVIVPVSCSDGARGESSMGLSPNIRNDRKFSTTSNVVTLKVTDESGNVTNTRKLSATPSFITRSTSEKVPNRSQIMSEVQRTAWARHTTK